MSDDYLWDGSGDPPADVARLETLLAPLRHGAPRPAVVARRGVGSLAAAALLVVAAGAAAWSVGRMGTRADRPSWAIARLDGVPDTQSRASRVSSRLDVGGWLETGEDDFALVEVADIGEVVVWPESRISLVATGEHRHVLDLAHGRIDATVDAPPRLFFVRTPSALAADLGCAYSLTTDEDGDGVLRVTSGAVSLERPGRAAVVPAGAVCSLRAERGPGTPLFEDAPVELARAVTAFDESGDASGVVDALELVRAVDTMTLWNLLPATEGSVRDRLVARMEALVPLPDGVPRAAVLRLERDALDAWYDEIEWEW